MKISALFASVMLLAAAVAAIAGCAGSGGPAPVALSLPAATPTAPAHLLYVDHNGTLYEYVLPLSQGERPQRTLTEWPGLALAPQIAVGPYGDVAVASPQQIRIFRKPIDSFAPSQAALKIKLTPAITEIGLSGADLVDMEYDPNQNLWLFNNLGGEVSELRNPLSKSSVAAVTIQFGAPGSKTAGYSTLVQGRFDVNAALYVYALASTRGRLFKVGFPYAKPPGSLGINLAQADIVDSSQYLPQNPNPASLLLGQYIGILSSPHPGSPPSPPVDVLGQFPQPLDPQTGLFPNAHVSAIVGALVADPPRSSFYTLDAGTGRLDVFALPLKSNAKPSISLPCLGGPANCSHQSEHLFLAP
ncbi:MAG: hypothetical protein WA814_00315 [Candidatus Baltobacteraceae bacterium]